ncbi:hypothetical protein [Sulfuricurvum sp.]|nr:hypothetical protein [Sulfuricurvum sp.]
MSKIMTFGIMGVIIMLLSGCGYKAPPHYEKPAPQKGSSVAL